ncbi:MAG: hypothetical protein ABJC79_06065 [Acidimicrobiia bacterium]
MSRRLQRVRIVVTVALLLTVVSACGLARPPIGPATSAPPDRPISSDGGVAPGGTTEAARRAGFNPGSGILWMDDADRQRELDAMVATGARWIAIDFDWNSIQGDGPDSFRWDRSTDTVVGEAHARGLRVIGALAYSPPWARRAQCASTSHCLPADPDAYARFARAAVERYGPASGIPALRNSVRVWQIWNEANHYPFVQPTVDIPGYTLLLRRAYAAIKLGDSGTTVLAGATSPAGDDPSGRDVAPVTFLRGIYANGGGNSFDAFAHHPYSFPESPLTAAPWNAFGQTRDLHDVMTAHGDSAKKVWGTEAGAGTGTDSKSVSASRQSQLLREYYSGWNGEFRSFTGPLLWFTVRDSGTDPASIYENFGILRHDFRAKPARDVFVSMLKA